MAQQKDLLSRLADRGENVIGKITDLPGAHALTDALGGFRERLDDLTKRVTGMEGLERRVADLERRLNELTGEARPRRVDTRSSAVRKTEAAVKKGATRSSAKSRPHPAPPSPSEPAA